MASGGGPEGDDFEHRRRTGLFHRPADDVDENWGYIPPGENPLGENPENDQEVGSEHNLSQTFDAQTHMSETTTGGRERDPETVEPEKSKSNPFARGSTPPFSTSSPGATSTPTRSFDGSGLWGGTPFGFWRLLIENAKFIDKDDLYSRSKMDFVQIRRICGEFMSLVNDRARDRVFFNSKSIKKIPYPIIDDPTKLALKLLTHLSHLFEKGQRILNGEGKTYEEARAVIGDFLVWVTELYEKLRQPKKDSDMFKLTKFLIISLVLGPDRATLALSKRDGVFEEFSYGDKDFRNQHFYLGEDFHKEHPSFTPARLTYYFFMRGDMFDPLGITKSPKGQEEIISASWKKEAEQQRRDKELAESRRKLAEMAKKEKEEAARKAQQNEELEKEKKPESKASHRQPTPAPTVVKQNIAGLRGIMKSPSRQSKFSMKNVETDQGSSDSGDTSTEEESDDDPPRNQSRISIGNVPFTLAYTPLTSTDDGQEQGDSDDSTGEEHSSGNTTPIHHQKKIGDPYCGAPLTKAGKVYDPSKTFEHKTRTEDQIKEGLERLLQTGMSIDKAIETLGISMGVAQTILSLTKQGKQKRKKYVKISPPKDNIHLNADAFNYNIKGKTVEDILGTEFKRTRFPNEAARISAMNSIFQKVLNHPDVTRKAYNLILGQIGQIDANDLNKQHITNFLTGKFSKATSHTDMDLVPPPELGDNDLDAHTLKVLQTRIGLGPEEKFSVEDIDGTTLKNHLINLRAVITNAHLRESEAYALLKRVTKGVTLDTVHNAELESGIPFNEFWIQLQETQMITGSVSSYAKKLKAVLNQEKVDCLQKSLNEIMVLNQKVHSKESDPLVRKFLCQRDTLRDFRLFIRRHYAPYISQVNTVFTDRLHHMALTRNDPTYMNEETYHAGKVQLFLTVACAVLAKCEADDYKPNKDRGQRTYVSAAKSSSDEPETPPQSKMEEKPRTQTPGPPRGGRPQTRNDNRNFQNQNRFPSRGPSAMGRKSQMGARPKFRCHLCNIMGHSHRICRTYAGEEYGPNFCPTCGGRHTTQCRTNMKALQLQEDRLKQQQQNPKQNTAHVSAVENPRTPAPPINNYDQHQQRPQNYNRSSTPYQGNAYGQNRPYYNNYQDGRRSQSGYRGGRNSNYGRNYGGNRSGYNNDGRRSQSGYRPQNRGYNYPNYNRPNTPYNGPPRDSRPYYNNQGPRNYGQRPSYGNQPNQRFGHNQPYQPQQETQPADNNTKPTGIGNNGHQPLHPAAMLTAVDAQENMHEHDSQ